MEVELTREVILYWMSQDNVRTVLDASVEFDVLPQAIHDLLNGKNND